MFDNIGFKGIVLGLSLSALFFSGCNTGKLKEKTAYDPRKDPNFNSEYLFDGRLENEYVKFYKGTNGMHNFLFVRREDGKEIKYADTAGNDLRLEYVEIIKPDGRIQYRNDRIGSSVLQEAQNQFDRYLVNIVDKKKADGLNDIKK